VHEIVDLRSDTVTWGEDPTVARLERHAATLTGLEAGLFVSSGTLGNLVSVLAQSQPGQEIILDVDSHIFTSTTRQLALPGLVACSLARLPPHGVL
jgi:threonine aldolase